mmetsp:Transcript_28476/g.61167  ORF Transcript_28476/g.61167 Transcript_28476/m.61167 type:complete len:203 (+) Transcript_28476:2759-3367(+)
MLVLSRTTRGADDVKGTDAVVVVAGTRPLETVKTLLELEDPKSMIGVASFVIGIDTGAEPIFDENAASLIASVNSIWTISDSCSGSCGLLLAMEEATTSASFSTDFSIVFDLNSTMPGSCSGLGDLVVLSAEEAGFSTATSAYFSTDFSIAIDFDWTTGSCSGSDGLAVLAAEEAGFSTATSAFFSTDFSIVFDFDWTMSDS